MNFCVSIPAIIITGMGYPSVDCRRLLKFISSELMVPTVGLFDYNVDGWSIFCTFKFGGARLSKNAMEFSTTSLQWLGMLRIFFLGERARNQLCIMGVCTLLGLCFGDIEFVNVPPAALASLSRRDLARLDKLATYFSEQNYPFGCEELRRMRLFGKKVEIQQAADFLSAVFPQKLLRHDFR